VTELSSGRANRLSDTFVRCYEDYRGSDPRKREALVELILEVFSPYSANAIQIEEFLEIVDQ
jgi:hypothetical protein